MCISSFSKVLQASRRCVKFPQSLKQLEVYCTSPNTCRYIDISFSTVREQQGWPRRQEKPAAEEDHGTSRAVSSPAGWSPSIPKLGKQSRVMIIRGLINSPVIIREGKVTSHIQGQTRKYKKQCRNSKEADWRLELKCSSWSNGPLWLWVEVPGEDDHGNQGLLVHLGPWQVIWSNVKETSRKIEGGFLLKHICHSSQAWSLSTSSPLSFSYSKNGKHIHKWWLSFTETVNFQLNCVQI